MPIYEYRCLDCLNKFDLMRRVDQRDTPTQCPNCAGNRSVRAISLPVAFSHSADGSVISLGSSPCSSCVATTCSGCTSER